MSFDTKMHDDIIITDVDKKKIVSAINAKINYYLPNDSVVRAIQEVFINENRDIEVYSHCPGNQSATAHKYDMNVYDMNVYTYVIVPWAVFLYERLNDQNVHMFLQ